MAQWDTETQIVRELVRDSGERLKADLRETRLQHAAARAESWERYKTDVATCQVPKSQGRTRYFLETRALVPQYALRITESYIRHYQRCLAASEETADYLREQIRGERQ